MAKTKTTTKTAPKRRTKTVEAPPEDLRDRARALYLTEKEAYFDFAVAIFEIYKTGVWKEQWGFETWKECAQKEWGMSERSAYNRITAGEAIEKYGITKEQAAKAGWSNFVTMASALRSDMTKAEVNKHLKAIEGKTHDEVERYKKDIKHEQVGGQSVQRVTLTFRFLDEQAEVVLAAINQCKELAGEEHDDTALEYICVEWAASHKVSASKVEEIKKQLTPQPEETKGARKERVDKGNKKAVTEEEDLVEEEEELDDEDFDEEEEEDFDEDDLLEDEE